MSQGLRPAPGIVQNYVNDALGGRTLSYADVQVKRHALPVPDEFVAHLADDGTPALPQWRTPEVRTIQAAYVLACAARGNTTPGDFRRDVSSSSVTSRRDVLETVLVACDWLTETGHEPLSQLAWRLAEFCSRDLQYSERTGTHVPSDAATVYRVVTEYGARAPVLSNDDDLLRNLANA